MDLRGKKNSVPFQVKKKFDLLVASLRASILLRKINKLKSCPKHGADVQACSDRAHILLGSLGSEGALYWMIRSSLFR